MTAVTGFNDRNMLNQCLLYRYIISYEPYNFKGTAGGFPADAGVRQADGCAAQRNCTITSGRGSSAGREERRYGWRENITTHMPFLEPEERQVWGGGGELR